MSISNERIEAVLRAFALADESARGTLHFEVKRLLKENSKTHENALSQALNVLHRIGSALRVKKLLVETRQRTEPIQRSLEGLRMTEDEVEKLAFQTWEEIVLATQFTGSRVKEP